MTKKQLQELVVHLEAENKLKAERLRVYEEMLKWATRCLKQNIYNSQQIANEIEGLFAEGGSK